MSLFQGKFTSGGISNHIFKTSDIDFEALELYSFTLSSCSEIWNKNKDTITVFLKGNNIYTSKPYKDMATGTTIFDLIPELNSINGSFIYYDKDTNSMQKISRTYNDWKQIIQYNEQKFNNTLNSENPLFNKTIDMSKTSINKGISFTFKKNLIFPSMTGDITYILQFLNRKMTGDNDKDLRIAGLSSEVPTITVPQTIAGSQFSIRKTDYDINEIGRKESIQEGGIKNPHNTVAAQVDYYMNESTGKLESGTRRMLATLLTDIEPAQLRSINISPSDLDSLTPNNFIDKDSDTFMPYNPPTGLAMSINVQANNPNLLTPNFTKQCVSGVGKYKPETVIVTNRFNKSYKKGTTVFLTRIGKEWIPEEQVQDLTIGAAKVGEWTFSKLIVDSDNYLKHSDWAKNAAFPNSYNPTDYETASRWKFYVNANAHLANQYGEYYKVYYPGLLDEVNSNNLPQGWDIDENKFVNLNNLDYIKAKKADANTYLLQFNPSDRYLISTIFDQLSKDIGGWQEQSWISRTNMNQGEFEGDKRMKEIGMFWGPVYVDGYKNIITDSEYSKGVYISSFNNNVVDSSPHSKLAVSYGATKSNSTFNDVAAYVPTRNDVPAECTSYILDPINIFSNWESIGSLKLSDIVPKNLIPPYQKSVKINLNKIQFIPLSANLVGYNDLNSSNSFTSYERNFYDRGREYFRDHYNLRSIPIAKVPDIIWGYSLYRYQGTPDMIGDWPHSYDQYKGINYRCQLNATGIINSTFNAQETDKLVTYDCYILRDPFDAPLGVPENLFNDFGRSLGGNCVGVICGKTTLSKRGGGNINLVVTSSFGFNPFSTVTGGQFSLSIIPLGGVGVPLLMSNDLRNNPGRPQFGSYSDDIKSYGTTSLSVRIFDAWPTGLTIFDPRYFGVLHFNPGDIGSLPQQLNGIDQISTSVDFRVPTWSNTGEIIPTGTVITSGNKDNVAPVDNWKVNPIRRGMLLTNGGFTYYKQCIGVFADNISIKYDPEYIDISNGQTIQKYYRGKKYSSGVSYPIKNGLEIEITADANGEIIGIKINTDNDGVEYNGEFSHTDFPFEYTLPLPVDSNGVEIPGAERAVIVVSSGKVYALKKTDLPPVEQVPITRVSSSSSEGKKSIEETRTSTYTLEPNKDGKYDIFTHFHNDITHTIMYHPLFGEAKLQYITMDIV